MNSLKLAVLLIVSSCMVMACGGSTPSSQSAGGSGGSGSGGSGSGGSGSGGSGSSAVPTYIEAVSEASTQAYPNGASSPDVHTFYFQMPFPIPAGDCVFVDVTTGSNSAVAGMSASDNGGNSYTRLGSAVDASDGGTIAVLSSLVTTPASTITVTWTGVQVYVHAGAVVFSGVSGCTAPDQLWTHAGTTSSTTATAGSAAQSPSASGDLMLMWTLGTSGAIGSFTPGSQSDISWKLVPGSPQITYPTASQWGIDNSTAAINPTLTLGTATTYAAIAVAVKAGSSGSTAPTGKVPTAIAHWDVSGWTGNNGSTVTEQMATSGGALVLTGSTYCSAGGAGYFITGISDSAGDTWVQDQSLTNPANCAAAGYAYIWHALNVAPTSSLTVTLTMNAVPVLGEEPDTALTVYDVQNLTAFDTSGNAIGDQTNAGTLATASLTPGDAGEFVVTVASEDFYGIAGVTGDFTHFEMGSWLTGSGLNQCGPIQGFPPPNIPDECDGTAWMNSSGTSAIIAEYASTGYPAQYWASAIAAFR
jgi:hypothetical protein